jgi:hypothetical protein
MLQEGRIPLSAAEHEAVDALIAANPGVPISLTRRDAGESGPLIVHVADGYYEVSSKGKATFKGVGG